MIRAQEIWRKLLRIVWLLRQKGAGAVFSRLLSSRFSEPATTSLGVFTKQLAHWHGDYSDSKCKAIIDEIKRGRAELNEAFNSGDFTRYMALGGAIGYLKDELAQARGLNPNLMRIIGSSFLGPLGHIAMLDIFLKGRQLGIIDYQDLIVLAEKRRLPNAELMHQWSDQVQVQEIDSRQWNLAESVFGSVAETADFIRTRNGYQHSMFLWDRINRLWDAQDRQPLLKLSTEHRERGYRQLEGLGISRSSWFVVFHVREQARGESALGRNADIDTYVASMRAVTDRGGVVVRTGDATMKKLPKMKNVFDYAHSHRRIDWMDVFFWAQCHFFVGTASGPAHIPGIFGRPVLATNVSAPGIIFPYSTNALMITKKFVRQADGEILSIEEALLRGVGWNWKPGDSQKGVYLIDNSEEEILGAVEDMLNERNLQGLPPTGLQRRFLEIRENCGSKITTAISPSFLESAEVLFR